MAGRLVLFKQHLEKRQAAPAEETPVCLPSITRADSCCQALCCFSCLSNNISPAKKEKKGILNIGKSNPPPATTHTHTPPSSTPPIPNVRESTLGLELSVLAQGHISRGTRVVAYLKICALADGRALCRRFGGGWGEETRSVFGRGESRSGVAFPSKDTACANRPGAGTITAPSPSRAGLTNDRSTP